MEDSNLSKQINKFLNQPIKQKSNLNIIKGLQDPQ